MPSLWSKLSLTPSNIIFLRAELRINYFFFECFQSQEPRTFWRLCSERPFNSAWSSGSLMALMTMMTIMTMMTKMTLLTTRLKRNSTLQVGPLDLRATPWRTYISRWQRLLQSRSWFVVGGRTENSWENPKGTNQTSYFSPQTDQTVLGFSLVLSPMLSLRCLDHHIIMTFM